MSGGYFDYAQYHIDDIACALDKVIVNNCSEESDKWGDRKWPELTPETIHEFKKGLNALKIAAIYANRIDWLLSCDDGEDSFHQRLNEELQKI